MNETVERCDKEEGDTFDESLQTELHIFFLFSIWIMPPKHNRMIFFTPKTLTKASYQVDYVDGYYDWSEAMTSTGEYRMDLGSSSKNDEGKCECDEDCIIVVLSFPYQY